MIPALLEGVRSVVLPCTIALILPGIVVVLAGVGRAVTVGSAYLVSTAVVIWLRSVGWFVWDPMGAGALVAAALVLAGVIALWWGAREGDDPVRMAVAATGSAVTGLVAATIWLPCVGPELGDLLSRARAEPWSVALPLMAFVVGALVPVIAAVAVVGLVGPQRNARLAPVGLVLGVSLAVLIALGRHDDVAATLYRWSL